MTCIRMYFHIDHSKFLNIYRNNNQTYHNSVMPWLLVFLTVIDMFSKGLPFKKFFVLILAIKLCSMPYCQLP